MINAGSPICPQECQKWQWKKQNILKVTSLAYMQATMYTFLTMVKMFSRILIGFKDKNNYWLKDRPIIERPNGSRSAAQPIPILAPNRGLQEECLPLIHKPCIYWGVQSSPSWCDTVQVYPLSWSPITSHKLNPFWPSITRFVLGRFQSAKVMCW